MLLSGKWEVQLWTHALQARSQMGKILTAYKQL